MQYVVSLFNTSCNINITLKKLEIIFNTYKKKLKNNTNGHVNEILFNLLILVPFIKVLKNPKIQMEHSHLVVELNQTQFYFIFFDWAFYNNNIFELLEVCPNLTYYAKNI